MNVFDFVEKDTVSPNGLFYYQIKNPIELNKAAFGSEIAFYNADDLLLHYKKHTYAHMLQDPYDIEKRKQLIAERRYSEIPIHGKIRVASWSTQGNMAYAFEYFWDKMGYPVYQDVFLDLLEGTRYVIPANVLPNNVVGSIRQSRFDELEVVATLNKMNSYQSHPLIKDKLDKSIFSPRWYK